MKTQAQISTQELAGCKLSFLSEAEERPAQDDTNLSALLDACLHASDLLDDDSGEIGQLGLAHQPGQCYL